MSTSFQGQCERIERLVKGGCVTPELGSLMLHYYALGRNESSEENCDAMNFAVNNFNPSHENTLLEYRTARPARLGLTLNNNRETKVSKKIIIGALATLGATALVVGFALFLSYPNPATIAGITITISK